MTRLRLTRPALLAVALAVLASLAVVPSASGVWKVKGHGYGHGVGMSQYGAYGMAQQGRSYRQIVGRYFRGTRIGSGPKRKVKVLVGSGSVGFSHAKRACGRDLKPGRRYSFAPSDGRVILKGGRRDKRLASCGGSGIADSKAGRIAIGGKGRYRGDLLATMSGGSMLVINKVSLDDYVAGVIAGEMPSSWHQQALRAQAVVARSYGVATDKPGPFDHYDDTRSQVYGGIKAETATTNDAVAATRGEVAKYEGDVATTFFFSTSGGRTESSQFGFGGGSRVPYLRSIDDDRFDRISPHHDWRMSFSDAEMSSKLSGLYQGRLKAVRIAKRGDSPRIAVARIVGSRGSSRISGPDLRFRLGLMSAWASFRHR